MIFVDSNIPMYLVSAPHRHKDDARRLLERFVAERTPLVTDARCSRKFCIGMSPLMPQRDQALVYRAAESRR